MRSLSPAVTAPRWPTSAALLVGVLLAHGLLGLWLWGLTPSLSAPLGASSPQRATAPVYVDLRSLRLLAPPSVPSTGTTHTATPHARRAPPHASRQALPSALQTAVASLVVIAVSTAADADTAPAPPAAVVAAVAGGAAKLPALETATARTSATTSLHRARPDHDNCPAAPYPTLLRERGIEGVVRVQVRVNPEGRAAEARVVGGSGWRLFDEAAVQRALACQFLPARRGQEAVEGWVDFPVRFVLLG
jgi:periplasmic protein TonB